MKVITIGALKGGVGKTNFCFNLATFLAGEKNKRVLVIDLDPQGNLTQNFQLEPDESYSMKLFERDINLANIIFLTNFANLSIIPTDIQQATLELRLSTELAREKILTNIFKTNKEFLNNHFDYILIDTNPSLNLTNTNAFAVADSIILICDNSIHSLRSLQIINTMWRQFTSRLEIPYNIKAIVFNNFDHFQVSKDFKEYLLNTDLKDLVIDQEIRKKTIYKKSEISGEPILKLLPRSENPYFNVVGELEQKGVL